MRPNGYRYQLHVGIPTLIITIAKTQNHSLVCRRRTYAYSYMYAGANEHAFHATDGTPRRSAARARRPARSKRTDVGVANAVAEAPIRISLPRAHANHCRLRVPVTQRHELSLYGVSWVASCRRVAIRWRASGGISEHRAPACGWCTPVCCAVAWCGGCCALARGGGGYHEHCSTATEGAAQSGGSG